MNVTVFGATGAIGQLIVAELLTAGHTVTAHVAIVAVTRAELAPLLRALTSTGRPSAPADTDGADGPLRAAMVVAAMARAATEFDLQRTIVYHPRIATSRAFAEALPAILAALPGR